jgi:hypothetical protein
MQHTGGEDYQQGNNFSTFHSDGCCFGSRDELLLVSFGTRCNIYKNMAVFKTVGTLFCKKEG